MSTLSSLTLAEEAKEHETLPQRPGDEESAPESKETEQHQATDPNIVDWEDGDEGNPRNWSTGYKCWCTFQLGMLAMAAAAGSSIIAPAEPAIAEYLGVGKEVTVLVISLYV